MKRPPNSPLDVVVAGLAVVDIIGKPVDFRQLPKKGGLQMIGEIMLTSGGNVSNVGIDLAKLGFRVGAITRLGKDSLAQILLKQYEKHSLDTSGVGIDRRAQTSATIVSVDRSGERTFLHTRGCMANFRASDILSNIRLIKRAKCFVLGYLGLLPEMEGELGLLLRTLKSRTGVDIVLDTGGAPHRFSKAQLRAFLSSVDYCIPSFKEAVSITGEKTPEAITDYLFQSGVRKVAGVKLGPKGCYVANRENSMYVKSSKVRRVVDTTGAGDAFVSGFVAGILKGFDPFRAARIGNAVAASCVSAIGASTAIGPIGRYL